MSGPRAAMRSALGLGYRALVMACGVLPALLCLCQPVARASERAQLTLQTSGTVPAPIASELRAAIAAQLAGLATVQGPTSAGRAGTPYVVLVDRSERGLELRFADAAGRALATPRVLPGPFGEAISSEIATIVYAFVVAVREREAADASARAASSRATGATTPRTSEPGATANAAAARREASAWEHAPRSWRLRVAALYTGTYAAPQLRWHDGVRGEASVRVVSGLYTGAGYAFFPAVELATAAATVQVRAQGLSAFVGYEHGWRGFALGSDMAAVLTDTTRRTLRTTAELDGTGRSRLWEASLALRLHARVRIPGAPRFLLAFAPALELALTKRDLVVEAEEQSVVLSPRWFRARADVGACFELL